jgi:probable HAF family extracellular repeat protein
MNMKKSLSLLTSLFGLYLVAGCGGGSGASSSAAPPPPPVQPLTITSGAPPNGSVQTAYGGSGSGFSLTGSGGKTPYTWSWAAAAGSSLPAGLGISAAGLISGTPTVAGTYNVTVTVLDAESPAVQISANYAITIAAPGALVITSGAPPNGTVGQTYGGAHSITQNGCTLTFSGWPLTAAGGTAGYQWGWSAAPGSSLPPGLTVSVASQTCGGSTRCCVTVSAPVIGGTPTSAGTDHVIVTVTDSGSPAAHVSASYTIVISSPSPAAASAMAAQSQPVAQNGPALHHHYQLIDLGTFGGPQSYVNFPPNYAPVLNDQSTVAGWADTSTPDPFPNFCFNGDCFVSHAFQSRNGVLPPADLGVLPGGSSSQANWISANGLIAGISQNGETDPLFPGFPEFRAVLWTNGQIANLGTLPEGGYESLANAVNSSGQVVGFATNTVPDDFSLFGTTQARAFLWQKGLMQDLGTLGGSDSTALLVNEQGQIVGESYTSSSPSAYCANIGFPLTTGAFLWENGKMTDLGSFGGSCTFASDLNIRGQVIGLSTLPGDTAQHPFLWDHGVLTDLGTLGGNIGSGVALNDAGDVVGWASLPGDQFIHASLWKNNTMIDLGTVGGDACSQGFSINLTGQVVGVSEPAAVSEPGCDFSQPRAFLWEGGGPMVDLNALIPPDSTLFLTFPETINDRGEITGRGVPQGCDNVDRCGHAFLLIPCDQNHPNIVGCDYSLVEAATTAQARSVQIAPAPTAPGGGKLSPAEMIVRFRSSMTNRYRKFGPLPRQ